MARKVPPRGADKVGRIRKPKSVAQVAADEAQQLDPTAELRIGGETVTVREYGFFQKSRVAFRGKAFIADLQSLVGDAEIEDAWDEIRSLFGMHEDFIRYAVAESIGKSASWVAALTDAELEPLVYLWFGIAGRFFFGEIKVRARGRLLKGQLAGTTSSGPSAGTSSASGGTPSGS